jgi:transmembrane sensor
MSEAQTEKRWDKNSQAIKAEAAVWVERRANSAWDQADQRELDAWIAASPAHLVAYLRADDIWKRADRLRALNRPFPMKADAESKSPRTGMILKIAAVFVVMALAGAGTAFYFTSPKQEAYSTTIGGRETLILSDGSRVELNTNTSLRVGYNGRVRTVWLDRGEAYFSVAHDPAHPFVVMLGDRRVTDLGTKFDIRREPGRTEIALLEGKARFDDAINSAQPRQTLLAPGDVVTATANSVSLEQEPLHKLQNELAWRSGMLVFEHATLADVAREYNRYNRTKLVIADAATAELAISGTLPATDIGAFTRMATKLFGLHVEQREGDVVVTR